MQFLFLLQFPIFLTLCGHHFDLFSGRRNNTTTFWPLLWFFWNLWWRDQFTSTTHWTDNQLPSDCIQYNIDFTVGVGPRRFSGLELTFCTQRSQTRSDGSCTAEVFAYQGTTSSRDINTQYSFGVGSHNCFSGLTRILLDQADNCSAAGTSAQDPGAPTAHWGVGSLRTLAGLAVWAPWFLQICDLNEIGALTLIWHGGGKGSIYQQFQFGLVQFLSISSIQSINTLLIGTDTDTGILSAFLGVGSPSALTGLADRLPRSNNSWIHFWRFFRPRFPHGCWRFHGLDTRTDCSFILVLGSQWHFELSVHTFIQYFWPTEPCVAYVGVGSHSLPGLATQGLLLLERATLSLSSLQIYWQTLYIVLLISVALRTFLVHFRGGLPCHFSHWPGLIYFCNWNLPGCWIFTALHFWIRRSLELPLAFWALELWTRISQFFQLHFQNLPTSFCRTAHIETPPNSPSSAAQRILPSRRSGPNSRRSAAIPIWGTFWLLLSFLMTSPLHYRGEGCNPAMGVAEVLTSSHASTQLRTKLHGERPPLCARTQAGLTAASNGRRKVEKRSLLRAYRRALHQGIAWYRGRTTPLDSGLQRSWQQCNQVHSNKRRMSVWQWNCGGLSAARMDEVKAWLVLHDVAIAVLLETRWTFESEWMDENWYLLHSGTTDGRGKGILIMISRKLCPPSSLSWQQYVPGRLVHARIAIHPRPIDVIACYQHTYNSKGSCLKDRDQVWNALDHSLQGVPNRHHLIVLGDFNCSLGVSTNVSGTDLFQWKGSLQRGFQHSDHQRLLHILRNHALTVLNAWSSALGPTFVHGDRANRLDYICVRQVYADGEARRVQYLWKSPFLDQTNYGHAPILCTLARYWIPKFERSKIQAVSMQQRMQSRQAFLAQSAQWQQFVQASQTQILELFQSEWLPADALIDSMHSTVMCTFRAWFPKHEANRPVPAWQPALPTLLQKWAHRRQMLKPVLCHSRNVFQAWFHATKYMLLKRLHRKQARQIRNARFDEVIHQAQQAERTHDTHKLFHVINQHSPKQPRRQMQLRTESGHLATQIESEAMLNHYVSTTWAGPSTNALTFSCPPGVPFSELQLARALAQIPATKAVAKHCGPGVIWKQHAFFLASLLYPKLQHWWSHNPPIIPASWRNGWMFWIPKPAKPPVSPQNLRPLALQEPIGKAIAGLLIQLAMREAHPHMVLFPIWAYMEHRSTLDAIRRVSLHCSEVRLLLQMQKSTPHSRAERAPRFSLFGGLQLSLDLRRAFDLVDRRKLFQQLHELHISDSLIQLLSGWHEQSFYFVQHTSGDCPISVGRGVRQGCKAAPGLWNCFLTIFFHSIMDFIPLEWIQKHVTAYADDIHIGATFTSLDEFEQLCSFLGIIMSTLESMDMQVNPDKSVVIFTMKGPLAARVRRQVERHTSDGTKFKIVTPGLKQLLIPVHRSTKYLGVVISYGPFEDDTLRHRIMLMQVGFHRLKRWLTGKHNLTVTQRYKLWQTCIFPILSYGIFATGLTPTGIRTLIPKLHSMIRRMLHDHSYVTHRTNSEALARHRIPTPLQLLHRSATSLLRTVTDRNEFMLPHDLTRTITWTHLPDLLHKLHQLQATGSLEPVLQPPLEAIGDTPFYQCSQCDFCTHDIRAFRRHCTVTHGQRMLRIHHPMLMDHFTDGLPTCTFCAQTFTTWRSFQHHTERGCQALVPGPAACIEARPPGGGALGRLPAMQPQPANAAMRGFRMLTREELANLHQQSFGQRLLHIINERTWERLARDQDACRYLSRRCILCSFQFSRCQELHLHYRQHHTDLWEHAPQKAVQLTNLYSSESPCACCGSPFRTHMCPTWSQIAVLLINGAGRDEDESAISHNVAHRCELCLELFSSTGELVQHMQLQHRLQGLSFNPSRDALDNQPACAHCGQVFVTMGGLKTHIVQGKCIFFNPEATAETQEIDPLWRSACLDGVFLAVLKPPMTRLRLTLTCQACGRRCQRAADLALHLQSAHSRLWRRSQRLTGIMVGAFYPIQCFCNPSLGIKRQNHVCLPFRQLAMSFHRLGQEPFAPSIITDQCLKDILSDKLARADRFKLEQAIVHRRFHDLWQDVELLHFASCQCFFCGAQPPTAELALHLHEEHPCRHEMVLFYLEQLIPLLQSKSPDDFRCQLCHLIFNLPMELTPDAPVADRMALSISHLRASCPAILQLSLLFASLLNGAPLPHGCVRLGLRSADDGSLQCDGSFATPEGPQPATGAQFQGPQDETAQRPKQSRRRHSRPGHGGLRRSTNAADAQAADSTGNTPRPGDSKPQKDRSIHSFFESRTPGSVGRAAERDHPMEATDGQGDGPDDATPTTSHAGSGEVAPAKSEPTDGMPNLGSAVQDLTGERAHLDGQRLSISQMGPECGQVGAGQENPHQCSEDGSTLGGAHGDASRSGPCGEIPRPAVDSGFAQRDSMEVTIEPSQRPTVCSCFTTWLTTPYGCWLVLQ